MSTTLQRRQLDLKQSRVQELLPEHFVSEYPDLVAFLEKYYEFLKLSDDNDFDESVKGLLSVRDIKETTVSYLDLIMGEIGNGIQASDFFDQPRLMSALLADYYRVKGSLNSIEGFFRGFFGEEVFIEYPKRNIFIVGESEIGSESLKFLQNDTLYQIFSILIKVGLSTADYEDLYKKFVHPAGFYFAGEVLIENELTFPNLDDIPGIADPRDSGNIAPVFVSEAILSPAVEFHELTVLYEQNGITYRSRVGEDIEKYRDLTTDRLDILYGGDGALIKDLMTPNSLTFDNNKAVMSLGLETMDNSMFTRYLSDSSY